MCNIIATLLLKNMSKPGENHMRIELACLCFIAFCASSASAESRITFYRDGTVIEQEAAALKGVINIPLAADLLENTLKIIPAPGTSILGVSTTKNILRSGIDKELETLTEQRNRMGDRLQALETREAIFTSAAKAQSGKAPRKTKANPDPMQAIRQGTDFAIAQLEAVYTARRRTTQEIEKLDVRIAKTRTNNRPAESSLRIAVTPPGGKVTVRYATSERGWQPQYNLHLAGDGSARLQLSAQVTGSGRKLQSRVSPGALSGSATAEIFPAAQNGRATVSYRIPVTEERYIEGIFNHFSGIMTNSTPHYLPPGDSGVFRGGTYIGSFRFEGISSGRSRVISLGK